MLLSVAAFAAWITTSERSVTTEKDKVALADQVCDPRDLGPVTTVASAPVSVALVVL